MRAITRRPTTRRSQAKGRFGALPVLVTILALVAGCDAGAGASPTAPATPVSTTPAGTAQASLPPASPITIPDPSPGAGRPTPSAEPALPWSDGVELIPLAPVADLEATEMIGGNALAGTALRLTSLDGSDALAMAGRLAVDPPVELAASAGPTPGTAIARPAAPLRRGTAYRVSLTAPDGTVQGSWAFQTVGPLRVVTTVPGEGSDDVPVDTGIEVTFDQDGVVLEQAIPFLSIEPSVPGRFVQDGRTIAFVPDSPLAVASRYRVTVHHGLPLADSGMTLENDEVFTFSTVGRVDPKVMAGFARTLAETGLAERAVFAVYLNARLDGGEDEDSYPLPKQLPVTVHRLPTLEAAVAAWRTLEGEQNWTRTQGEPEVATDGLVQVLKTDVRLEPFDGQDRYARWFRLPQSLPAGSYLVSLELDGFIQQSVLQVTDVAVYTMTTETRTLVWANDVAKGAPIEGATAGLAGASLGRTGADGLLVARTPDRMLQPDEQEPLPVVVVRSDSRASFVPAGIQLCDKCGGSSDPTSRWWRFLQQDRYVYRSTDTITAWGILRDRSTGRAPAEVTARLTAWNDDGSGDVDIATATARPDASAAFLFEIPVRDLPAGYYTLRLTTGDQQVTEQGLEIGPIVKPAWQVAVGTARHAVLRGSSLEVDATATFFEGTPVVGSRLVVTGVGPKGTITTGSLGTGSTTIQVRPSWPNNPDEDTWKIVDVSVAPEDPEEAQVTGEAGLAVFRANVLPKAAATVSGTRLTVNGTVHDVAWSRYEAPGVRELSDVDPFGATRAGARVRVTVTAFMEVRKKTGTTYDFITKRTVPQYTLTQREKKLGTWTVRTDARGRYRLRVPVSTGAVRFRVDVRAFDGAGRASWTSTDASDPLRTPSDRWAALEPTAQHEDGYSVGDPLRVQFTSGTGRRGGRYLWTLTQRGLIDQRITTVPTLAATFKKAFVPGVDINAVRFTGSGYEVPLGMYHAAFRVDDRRLAVTVTTDRERYAPGDTVTARVRVTDPAGKGVAGTVFVRAIDEKLFEAGLAGVADPLEELYAQPGSGILGIGWTHFDPRPFGGGGGADTTGGPGGIRGDFRDFLVNRLVTAGADGRAQITFKLSDDLTSWRVIATATTPSLRAGVGERLVPVSIPFFAEVTVAPEYLVTDKPTVRVRAYGTGLDGGDVVKFTVSSDTLLMAPVTVSAPAFAAVEIPLPTLNPGAQTLLVEAVTGTGDAKRHDALVRTFSVVTSRQLQATSETAELSSPTDVVGGSGLTTLVLSDGGRGRVVPLLEGLLDLDTTRSDRAVAASLAERVLRDAFGVAADRGLADQDLAAFRNEGGLAILPYAAPDLQLSALAALADDARLTGLGYYFRENEDATRETRLWVLAGRAAVGEPVLPELRAAAGTAGLTVQEQVVLALAATAAGDDAIARRFERQVLEEHGQTYGPWVRIMGNAGVEDRLLTARLAIVAASLGDPVATSLDEFVAANPPTGTAIDLERALAAAGWAARVPAGDASARLIVGGSPRTISIAASKPQTVVLTPAQASGARLEPASGTVVVTTRTERPLDASSLTAPKGTLVTRTIRPTGPVHETDLVTVEMRVELGAYSGESCWNVTELVPSGLAPITGQQATGEGEEADGEAQDPNLPAAAPVIYPWRATGQRLDFCVSHTPNAPVSILRYVARVVTPGTYTWEPAILQSGLAPDQGMLIPAPTLTILGAS